jgi:hypothetical protein
MGFSSKVNIMHNGKVKARNQGGVATEQEPASAAAAKPARSRRLLWIMLLLLVGAFGTSYLVFAYLVPRVFGVPRELVGTWQVIDGDMKGATLEFRWYGAGSATMIKQGKKEVAQSSVLVRGKRIFMTYKNPMGQEDTVIQTIVKLTDDELVIRDQDQITYNLIRIGD